MMLPWQYLRAVRKFKQRNQSCCLCFICMSYLIGFDNVYWFFCGRYLFLKLMGPSLRLELRFPHAPASLTTESVPVEPEEWKCFLPSGMSLLTVLSSCELPWTVGFAQAASQQKVERSPATIRSPSPCTSIRMWPYMGRGPTYALVASGQKDTFHFFEAVLIICISTSGCFPFPAFILRGAGPPLLMESRMLWDSWYFC